MSNSYVTIVGTLITRVDRRRLADDNAVANFRVASNRRRIDRATGEWVDGDTLYVSVSCWRQLAENVNTSFAVGDPIIVWGRLRSRSYDDRDGRRQSVIEVEGLAIGPDLTRATARITRFRRDGVPVVSRPDLAEVDDSDVLDGPAAGPGIAVDADDAPVSDDPWRVDVDASGEHERGASQQVEAAVGA